MQILINREEPMDSQCSKFFKRITGVFMLLMSFLISTGEAGNAVTENRHKVSSALLQGDTLDAPELRCLTVQDSGEINLHWLPVADPSGSFHAYILYRSDAPGGPYDVVDTVWSRAQDFFQDISPAALPGNYYYMSTVSEVLPQQYLEVPGDTMRSILLTAVSPGPNSGLVSLNWNDPFYSGQNSNPLYYIYKRNLPGNWRVIDSVHSNTYSDTITVCQGEIDYQIRIPDSTFCINQSNSDGGTFEDKIPPETPKMDSVSVLNGDIHISWNVNPISDTWGYIIFKIINNLWTPLDTLYGIDNIHYIDSLADGCSVSEVYNVLAFDSCWNTSSSGNDHRNMVLQLEHDVCQGEASLSWNGYLNMRPSLEGYQIYRSENGNAPQMIHQNNAQNTTFIDSTLSDSTRYCYFVRAVSPGGIRTSTTCELCLYHKMPASPDYIYLSSASVDHNSGAVQLRGIVDTSEIVTGINIYRSKQAGAGYQLLTTLPFAGTKDFDYEDHTALSDSLVYYYQAFAKDSCDREGEASNVLNNILLEGEAVSFMNNRITWNEFDGWYGQPSKYDIFRIVEPETSFQPVNTDMFYSGGSYVDDVSALAETSGEFYYYVKAREGDGNPYGIKDSSFSNRVLIRQESRVYIPNAFRPEGYNKIFKPYNVYMDMDDYRFEVYNRWGEKVFSTNKPGEGWDGTVNGSYAPAGTYVYLLKFKRKNGKDQTKKGSVILLR
ncbi:MAG: gliding motility-associated C-terminal domain-containing protein [Bacteroidales bacterium]